MSVMKITFYDPPSGWKYGFPKEYKPIPTETLEQTLLRDGYPKQEIDNGGARAVRFWEEMSTMSDDGRWGMLPERPQQQPPAPAGDAELRGELKVWIYDLLKTQLPGVGSAMMLAELLTVPLADKIAARVQAAEEKGRAEREAAIEACAVKLDELSIPNDPVWNPLFAALAKRIRDLKTTTNVLAERKGDEQSE